MYENVWESRGTRIVLSSDIPTQTSVFLGVIYIVYTSVVDSTISTE